MTGSAWRDQRGQVTVLLVAGCLVLAIAAVALGQYGTAFAARGRLQRGADGAAVAAAKRMSADYPRLMQPPLTLDGLPNPQYMTRHTYVARARAAARLAVANSRLRPALVRVVLPSGAAPRSVSVTLHRGHAVVAPMQGRDTAERVELRARAVARLSFEIADLPPAHADRGSGGGYDGPLAYRQGKPMRPDVAAAFDRMHEAARAAGLSLTIASAFRSDAEQARLFARRPDPKWVAPPGTSLHRYGTELDLGPPSAYAWLAANARRFGFIKRYAWEPWHFGYGSNPRDVPAQYERGSHEPPDGRFDGRDGMPSFVPPQFAGIIAEAAQRRNVQPELLAAQLKQESDFDPNAVSGAGAQGIAQFMPGTAREVGLRDPFDPRQAIDAQAKLMHGLIRAFGSVSLALAAYNAGPGAVRHFGGIPPYPETRAYVARILLLMKGGGSDLGDPAFAGIGVTPVVQLIE